MTSATAKGILDSLTAGGVNDDNEEARKIYVGASRAERLLVIALPRTQAERLRLLIAGVGAGVVVTQI
jgi:DNA helicase-2/ATP-dependent DNA helicase PcrA